MSVGDGKSARASRNSRRLPRVPEILPFTEGLLILGILLAVCGIFPDGRIICEAKETGMAVMAQKRGTAAADEQEVIEFVTAYRKALSPEGIDTLADYVDNPDDVDFQRDLLRNQAMFKLGVTGWENIRVIAKPMSDGKHWVASVSSDLLTDNFNFGIPGLIVLLVEKDVNGDFKIMVDNSSELSDAFLKEVREICLSDEIVEHSNETAAAYNDLLAEHPELVEWLESTQMAVDEEVNFKKQDRGGASVLLYFLNCF